jgi:CTP synthase
MCGKEAVIPALDAPSIYSVPAQYHAEGLDEEVLRAFGIEDAPQPELSRWIDIMDRYANPEGEVTIGVVGKYVGLPDAYKSLHEALVHGGLANRVKVHIRWIDAELFEQPIATSPRGWSRCTASSSPAGSVNAGRGQDRLRPLRARTRRALLRHLLGMQMACIEGARNTAGIANASTTEFGETNRSRSSASSPNG